MRILEIEQLFQSESTLIEILNKLEEDFNKIDYFSNLMKSNVTNNPEECKKALNELTGIYMSLKPVCALAETEVKNRKGRKYENLRIDAENNGKKFTSTVGEKQADVSVSEYRRIRNIIQGYVSACEKSIQSAQSILKYFGEEMKLNK